MWMKWVPWRFIIQNAARKNGFLDPVEVFTRLERFAQPSEVAAPIQLLRSGVVLHARGLVNSQAIQHNLDWVWPYWVERQFNPEDSSFIPRAFSITHINLTHRNWTAVGLPDCDELPIVDPRGLVTPFFDGWSIDCWMVDEERKYLLPSRLASVTQSIDFNNEVIVTTDARAEGKQLTSKVSVIGDVVAPVCQIQIEGTSQSKRGWIVVALRPYNPEGVSFIHDVELLSNHRGWRVNDKQNVNFDVIPDKHVFSDYLQGDVFSHLSESDDRTKIRCKVGLATAAAQFELSPNKSRNITLAIPLKGKQNVAIKQQTSIESWDASLQDACQLSIPDDKIKFLYDVAVRTLVLHSPDEVYPGPYTYKRFWFRDAAFILHAMLCMGLKDRVRRVMDFFPSKQTLKGYFLSQEGEWDSNGEALWIMEKYCRMTGNPLPEFWHKAVDLGGRWIMHKRLKGHHNTLCAGLFPPGFSAEHLGPNDYYYWDDFWGVAGLKAAGYLTETLGHKSRAQYFWGEAKHFMDDIEQSLFKVVERLEQSIIPASPYRRMDAGAIGSIVVDYPLKLWPAKDARLTNTMDFLLQHCCVKGGFFQDMTHSGINPYLTLHMAQVLLRSGDNRYFDLMQTVAKLASSTGQWPEAIHPITLGGCMGDGQHVWAAAEWILMIRNCFVREEENRLILGSGVPKVWIGPGKTISFGPVHTDFGTLNMTIKKSDDDVNVCWEGEWLKEEPTIEVALPGFSKIVAQPGTTRLAVKKQEAEVQEVRDKM